jgi:imidazolonepropionase
MAATLFRLTPEEAFAGVTRNAAIALGLGKSHGTLEAGKAADFAIFRIERPAELAYRIGYNPCVGRVRGGRIEH